MCFFALKLSDYVIVWFLREVTEKNNKEKLHGIQKVISFLFIGNIIK